MGACPTCPWKGSKGARWAGGRGPKDAPLVIVGMAPGRSELIDGIPFVGASGRILASALASHGGSLQTCRSLNSINCFPAGEGDKITPEQKAACAERLRKDLAETSPLSVLCLGGDALEAVTGLGGPGNGISAWQGYILKPVDLPRHNLPPTTRVVVPAYHPSFVIRSGLKPYPWLKSAVGKAVRASRNRLVEEAVPTSNSTLPSSSAGLGAVSFDIETDRDGGITDIGLAWSSRTEELATSLRWSPESAAATRLLLGSEGPVKVVFNGNFDIPRLRREGVEVKGPLFDCLWAAQVLDPDAPGFSLNEVAAFHFDMGRWKHKGNPGSRPGIGLSVRESIERRKEEEQYNRTDAFILLPLYAIQKGELEATGQDGLFGRIMDTLPTLVKMSERGLDIDVPERERLRLRYEKRAEWAERRWTTSVPPVPCKCDGGLTVKARKPHKECLGTGELPLLPRSPRVTTLLYDTWGLPSQFRFEGGKKTDKLTADGEAVESLLGMQASLPYRKALKALLRCRHYPKYIETYIDIGDRIFPSYAPGTKDSAEGGKRFAAGAATGRIIAKGSKAGYGRENTPPIQQMPKSMRTMVVAPEGMTFVAGDYDSQELRLVAYISGDLGLIEAVESGEDIHARTANALGCDRTRAKNAFYGWAYGASARALVRAFAQYGFRLPVEDAAKMLAGLSQMYPGVPRWHRRVLADARRDHFLTNGFGRRRYFYDPDALFNEITNFPIQSAGADMGWCIVNPLEEAAARVGGFLSILVHDEFVCAVPDDEVAAFVSVQKGIMEREFSEVAPGFRCPASMKVGKSWGRMTKWKLQMQEAA